MKLLYLALSFSALLLLDFYLKSNISGIGEGSLGLPILFLFLSLVSLLFVWRASTVRSIVIRRSVWVLLLFLVYLVFRIGIDIGTMDSLKAFTVATSGGVILFYSLGTFVAIIIGRHRENANLTKHYFKGYAIFLIAYLIASYGFLLSIFFELGSKMRTDIFLISDINGAYQRPGNFLTICYLMLITLYAQFIALKPAEPLLGIRLANIAIFTLFLAYTLTSLLIAQMIGSNNATVSIAGLGLITTAVAMLLWLKSIHQYLAAIPLNFARLTFGKVSSRLAIFSVFALVISIGVIWSVSSYLHIDLTMTRIFSFGSGEVSSVNTRLALLENFSIQFDYSPLFGNMNVDNITTGRGTYVHSLPGKLLTHTGLLGFFLFAAYLFLGLKERLKLEYEKSAECVLSNNIFNLFSLLFLSTVLLIAVVATSFLSATLWFSLGMFMVGIGFRSKYNV